jgi:hypothetical protein
MGDDKNLLIGQLQAARRFVDEATAEVERLTKCEEEMRHLDGAFREEAAENNAAPPVPSWPVIAPTELLSVRLFGCAAP